MQARVFIIDDHAWIRNGLRALMRDDPEITIVGDAVSGTLAENQLGILCPDVIVLALSHAGLDEIDAIQRIVQVYPQARVILLSKLGTTEQIYQALRAGARGYLLKESAGREVVEAIKSISAGNVYLSPAVMNTVALDYVYQRAQVSEKSHLEKLSAREREILLLVVDGKSSAEIGRLLHLSQKTVESYRSRMMHKLNTLDLPSLIKFAIRAGLVK